MKISIGPVSLYFLGQVKFRVISGEIKVNGRKFIKSPDENKWQSVFSPRSTALLCFESKECAEIEVCPLENGLEAIQNCQSAFNNIFSSDEIEGNFDEPVKGFFTMKPGSAPESLMPLLKISDEWKGVLEDIETNNFNNECPVVFVCGHRKVGKSTFSRFLLNGLLNSRESVDFIDLDPGQTEFTPAGFVSRTSFNSEDALLGPPFTHLTIPDDSIYLASSNGSEMPLMYCKALQTIKNNLKNHRQVPTVINTMGWMTGLGLELIQFALQVFKPTHVIAFMAPETENGISDIIRKCLCTNSFGLKGALNEVEAEKVHVNYMTNVTSEGARGKHSPADQRNLSYWAYFFGKFKFSTNSNFNSIENFNFGQLSSLRPFVVPLSSIQLACTSREINLFELIKPRPICEQIKLLESWLLLRLVGLGRDENFIVKKNKKFNLLSTGKTFRVAEMNCKGVGIVRAVSRVIESDTRIHLHIITPLPLEILSTTNTLILGSQHLPLAMLTTDQRSIQGEGTGYSTQTIGTDVTGSGVRKPRHNMRRN